MYLHLVAVATVGICSALARGQTQHDQLTAGQAVAAELASWRGVLDAEREIAMDSVLEDPIGVEAFEMSPRFPCEGREGTSYFPVGTTAIYGLVGLHDDVVSVAGPGFDVLISRLGRWDPSPSHLRSVDPPALLAVHAGIWRAGYSVRAAEDAVREAQIHLRRMSDTDFLTLLFEASEMELRESKRLDEVALTGVLLAIRSSGFLSVTGSVTRVRLGNERICWLVPVSRPTAPVVLVTDARGRCVVDGKARLDRHASQKEVFSLVTSIFVAPAMDGVLEQSVRVSHLSLPAGIRRFRHEGNTFAASADAWGLDVWLRPSAADVADSDPARHPTFRRVSETVVANAVSDLIAAGVGPRDAVAQVIEQRSELEKLTDRDVARALLSGHPGRDGALFDALRAESGWRTGSWRENEHEQAIVATLSDSRRDPEFLIFDRRGACSHHGRMSGRWPFSDLDETADAIVDMLRPPAKRDEL